MVLCLIERCGGPQGRGDSAFMSSVRTCFPQVQRFFQPQLGDGETFRLWDDNWSGQGRLDRLFPRLYALSTDQGVVVWPAWNDAWVPPLPQALSDQRVAELISTQELVADRNEVIFRGRTPSADAILSSARGFASFWQRGGLGPSIIEPL